MHGDPASIRAAAKHLTGFHTAFDPVGQGMRSLDSSHWKGESADTFREKYAMHPPKWLHAADACEAAGKALDSYADTVKWAQGQAQDAIDLYKKGKKASEQAVHSPGRLPAARQHDPVRSGLDGRAPGARSRSPYRQFLDGQSGTLGVLEKNVSSIGHIPYRDGVK
ncbi:WXG100 family type VII secretion target [Streptomyces sp. NPDC059340]|uniref:WXG100 family type VII secretion target n=1 Tax=Streptomyces sp. NPDC059340 TaxID=3346806 RepID=UPI0036B63443